MKEYISTDIQHMLEYISDGYIALDDHWYVTHLNAQAEELLKINKEEIIGQYYWSMIPGVEDLKFYHEAHNVLKTGQPSKFEEFYEPWGKWFQISIFPTEQGISIFFQDTTREKRFEIIHRRAEEISGVAGWELDVKTQRVFMTQKAYEIYGLEPGAKFDLEMNSQVFDEQAMKTIDSVLTSMIDEQLPREMELVMTPFTGEKKLIRVTGVPLVEDGVTRKLYGTLEDVTIKNKKETERLIALGKLESAQNIAQLGYWNHDIIKNISEWSENVYKVWERNPAEFTPNFENWQATLHPDDRDRIVMDLETVFKDKKYHDMEHRIVTPGGNVKWVMERITLHRTESGEPLMLEGIVLDITRRKKHERETLQALKEKETLLAEVHHRVKNNLAIISGLMQLQAYEEDSDLVQQKLLESISRIMSMASIHEQLYQSNSFSKLDYSSNLTSLVKQIIETIKGNTDVKLTFDLDPVELNVNQAIPLSLLINEVVTNILKHAFKGINVCEIKFQLKAKKDQIKITVTDNGVGLPENFKITDTSTLGIRLIDILSQQLEGESKFNSSSKGTSFTIEFQKQEVRGASSALLS